MASTAYSRDTWSGRTREVASDRAAAEKPLPKEYIMTAMTRNPGAGDKAMKIAPKMLRNTLPRLMMRSLTAALSLNREVKTA